MRNAGLEKAQAGIKIARRNMPEEQNRLPGILLVYLHMKPRLSSPWLGWNRDGQEEYVCLNFSRKFCIPNCFLWSVSSTSHTPGLFFFFPWFV